MEGGCNGPASGAPENDDFVTGVARGDRCLSSQNSAEGNLWRCSPEHNVAACWNVLISDVLGPKLKVRQSCVLPILPPAWCVIWASHFVLLYFIVSIKNKYMRFAFLCATRRWKGPTYFSLSNQSQDHLGWKGLLEILQSLGILTVRECWVQVELHVV